MSTEPSPTHDPTEALAAALDEAFDVVADDEATALVYAKLQAAALSAAGWHLTRDGDEELRAEALARALTEVQGGLYASWLRRAPLILAALDSDR